MLCTEAPEDVLVSSCKESMLLEHVTSVSPCLLPEQVAFSSKGQEAACIFSNLGPFEEPKRVDRERAVEIFSMGRAEKMLEGPSGSLILMNEGVSKQKNGDSHGAI